MVARIALLQEALQERAQDIIRLNSFLEKRETFLREGFGVFSTFYQRLLDSQDTDRTNHTAIVTDRDAAIARLIQEVARRDLTIMQLDRDRAERDGEIARLIQEIARLIDEVGRRDSTITQLDRNRTERDGEIARLHQEIERRDQALEAASKSNQELMHAWGPQKNAIMLSLAGKVVRLPFSRSLVIAARWCGTLLPGRRGSDRSP